jgi:hypothetical protein
VVTWIWIGGRTTDAFDTAWSLIKAPYKVTYKGGDYQEDETKEIDDVSGFGPIVYSGGSMSDPTTPYFIDNPSQALQYAVFGSAIPRTGRGGKPYRIAPMRETVPRLRRLDLRNVPFNEEAVIANPSLWHKEIQIPKEWEKFVEEVPKSELDDMLHQELDDYDYDGIEEDMEDVFINNNTVFGNTSANYHKFMEAYQHMKDARTRLAQGREGNITIPKDDFYHYHHALTDKVYQDPDFFNALALMEAARQGHVTSRPFDAFMQARGIDYRDGGDER